MTQTTEPRHLHLAAPNELGLPRTLRGYAETTRERVGEALHQKLGEASLWLQALGKLYGIVEPGSTEAGVLDGGKFYLPVVFAGMRRLTQVEDYRYGRNVFSIPTPRSEVAVFGIRDLDTGPDLGDFDLINNPNSYDMFMGAGVADYREIAVGIEQPITLLDDDEYWAALDAPFAYPPIRLIVDNTRGTNE